MPDPTETVITGSMVKEGPSGAASDGGLKEFAISPNSGGSTKPDASGGKQTPPGGQSGGGSGEGGQPQGGSSEPKQGAKPGEGEGQAPSRKDLMGDITKGIEGGRTPEEELALVREELSRSSKGSRWNNEVVKTVQGLLEKQGLKLIVNKTKNDANEEVPMVDLIPTDAYNPELTKDGFKVNVKALPDDVLQLASEDVQKFADHIAQLATKALVRTAPTRQRAVEPVTDERIDAVLTHLEGVKPELKEEGAKDTVKSIIQQRMKNTGFAQALAEDTGFMISMIADSVEIQYQRALKRHQEREAQKQGAQSEAEKAAGIMPSGESRATAGAGGAGQNSRFADVLL